MALVAKDAGPKERPPWRGVVVGAVAGAVFIFVLAVAAWLTRDTPNGVPPHDAGFADAGFPDAGPDDAGAQIEADDAGFVDAGAVEGPAGEPDSGPVDVAGPPVDAAEVAALVAPVVEECLKAALRFDPSLGGKATAHAVVARGGLSATMPAAPSPVLTTCVADKGRLSYARAPQEPVGVDVHLALDGLRQSVKITGADVVAP